MLDSVLSWQISISCPRLLAKVKYPGFCKFTYHILFFTSPINRWQKYYFVRDRLIHFHESYLFCASLLCTVKAKRLENILSKRMVSLRLALGRSRSAWLDTTTQVHNTNKTKKTHKKFSEHICLQVYPFMSWKIQWLRQCGKDANYWMSFKKCQTQRRCFRLLQNGFLTGLYSEQKPSYRYCTALFKVYCRKEFMCFFIS